MSDATLPPGGPERDLLFGVLALQLDFVGPGELQLALQAWYADRGRPLPDLLVQRGAIGAARVGLIERLADEFRKHHGDDAAALSAACAARAIPLDLDIFTACRGEVATLAAEAGTLPAAASPPLPEAEASSGPRFRVVRSHARGALGEVFLAVDEELHREVALKEMQAPYARSGESRARFLLEAEITGQLEHPGIVPIYGLGVHPDGRPYYAMRFIRGETLHDAVERFHLADHAGREPSERQLTLRGLLTRFVTVCNAIAYAHSRGILHRDVKPGNIMLGPFGETLVVDWGLAKALGRPDREDSAELPILPTSASPAATTLGTVVGTPAYMSPEQAAGRQDALGPASDVYALGATLYAVLTGEPPFQGEQVSQILDRVKRQDFVPPRRKNRTVPAALEAVVLKAMAASPAARYPGAKELADDVERWLADEPVSACPEPASQRVRRWARRHRMLVSGGLALLVTALIGLTVGLWALRQAAEETARERDAATANLALARKAVDSCFVLATADPVMQQERMRDARRLLLRKALPFYQGFRTRRPDDPELQAEEAMHLFKVGFITAEVGEVTEAIEAYEKARDAFAALAERQPDDDSHRVELARTANNLGNAYALNGERVKARAAYEAALALRKPLAQAHADDADAQLNLIETVNNLNALELKDGNLVAAAGHLADVERIARKLVDEGRALPRSLRTLGAARHNLGEVLVRQNKLRDAEAAYAGAVEAQRRHVAEGGRLTRPRSELASTLASYGALLDRQERYDEAVKRHAEARDLRAALADEYREFPEFAFEHAAQEDMLGSCHLDNARPKLAREAYGRALTVADRLTKEYAGEDRYRRQRAEIAAHVGNALRDDGQAGEALGHYAAALEVMEKGKGEEWRAAEAWVLAGRASAYTKLKRHRDAVKDWERARGLGGGPDADHCRVQAALSRLRAGDAAGFAKEAGELEKLAEADQPGVPAGTAAYELACLWSLRAGLEEGDAAEACVKRAMAFLERAKAADLFTAKEPLNNLTADDDDLKPLRRRPEFAAFVAGLGK